MRTSETDEGWPPGPGIASAEPFPEELLWGTEGPEGDAVALSEAWYLRECGEYSSLLHAAKTIVGELRPGDLGARCPNSYEIGHAARALSRGGVPTLPGDPGAAEAGGPVTPASLVGALEVGVAGAGQPDGARAIVLVTRSGMARAWIGADGGEEEGAVDRLAAAVLRAFGGAEFGDARAALPRGVAWGWRGAAPSWGPRETVVFPRGGEACLRFPLWGDRKSRFDGLRVGLGSLFHA